MPAPWQDVEVFSPVEGKPLVLCTLVGRDPSLPAVLLNSHYDVVPVVEDRWEVSGPRKSSLPAPGSQQP